MAKKKSTETVFYNPIIKDVPPVSQSSIQVAQIPPYPDKGIEYKFYYKKKVSGDEFVLRNQATRFYAAAVDFDNPGATLGTISSGKTFYCRSCSIQYGGFSARKTFIIYDGNANNPKFAFTLHGGGATGNLNIDFTDCPRTFLSTILLYTGIALWEDTAYITLSFYGWEEEN